ncbi:MAG: competence/damage-inducible protein A, partial [Albidovulum sp.]
IFQAMVASLLPRLTGGQPLLSQNLRVLRGEGSVAAPLAALAAEFSDLSFGSYPFTIDGAYGTNLVVRGQDAARLDAAMVRMVALFADGDA